MSRNRRRVLTYEERVLWTTVIKSMTPLRDPPSVAQDSSVNAHEAKPLRKPPDKRPKTHTLYGAGYANEFSF